MKIRALALGLGLSIAATGCSDDFLTTIPPDVISDASFWKTAKDAELAVNAVYPFLWGGQIIQLDATTDNALSHKRWLPPHDYALGIQNSGSAWHTTIWEDSYEAIRAANTVLTNIDLIPTMNEPLRERLKAEATFMRAYHHLNLVNLFGDVPLVMKPLAVDEGMVTRTPAAQVVDQVIADLDAAASVLPLTYGAGNRGRVTKGAALALKARAALYAGRYQVAADAANAVIGLNIYSLYPNYRDLFTYKGEGSAEVILDAQRIKDQYSNNVFALYAPFSAQGLSEVVPFRDIVDSYEMTDGLSIEASPLYDPLHPYENRDPRLDASMLRPGMTFNGKVYDSTEDSKTSDRIGNNVDATSTGYNLLKYIDATDAASRSNGGINFILIRYADVLLMYAEAKIELNQIDASVYAAINQVRQRPSVNMPPITAGKSQSQLRSIVRHERRIELAFEGLRLFDIRRWKIAEDVMPGKVYGIDVIRNGVRQPYELTIGERTFDPARDYLWPIPLKETELNPDLTQNPGY